MDKNKGKYHKLYKEEFDMAAGVLTNDGGELQWGVHEHEAFVYKKPGVWLVFYPHKTSAGNYHIRVRNNGSKDLKEADRIMTMLMRSTPLCTFSIKKRINTDEKKSIAI